MRTLPTLRLAAVLSLALAACAHNTPNPPLLGPTVPRGSLPAAYTRLRVIVTPFTDRTALVGGVNSLDTGPYHRSGTHLLPSGIVTATEVPGPSLVATLPDIITGMLTQSGRFEVLEDGGTSGCDLKLVGAITSASDSDVTLDLRLASCFTNSDMSAVNATIAFQSSKSSVVATRADIQAAVQKLVGTLPSPKEMKRGVVLSRQGEYVTLNVGLADKVMKGMKAFAVSYGDRAIDPSSSELLGDEIYTGDLYVFAVFDHTSRAVIVDEHGTRTRVGDYVVFK